MKFYNVFELVEFENLIKPNVVMIWDHVDDFNFDDFPPLKKTKKLHATALWLAWTGLAGLAWVRLGWPGLAWAGLGWLLWLALSEYKGINKNAARVNPCFLTRGPWHA